MVCCCRRDHIMFKGGEGMGKRRIKLLFALAGIIYFLLVVYWVLFDGGFGRSGFENLGNISFSAVKEHFCKTGNLVPFRTVKLFFKGFFITGSVSLKAFAINIFGNIFVFTPFGIILPLFFKKQKKLYVFLLTMAAFIFCIELFQLVLLTGSPDIDDLLLNLLGACTGWIATVKLLNKSKVNNKNRR